MSKSSTSNQDLSTSNQVQQISTEPEYAGQRIDNFLFSLLKGVPKTHIYRIIRKGEVRVNKRRIKPPYKLEAGDIIRIPPIRIADAKNIPEILDKQLAELQRCIIFEDKDLIILNKPSGLAVHGGSGINYGVIEGLRKLYSQEKRLELVHRLDRDTSGCLLVAKKPSVLKILHEMLRNNQIEKTYLALLKGKLQNKNRIVVDNPLRKYVTKSGERRVSISDLESGKEAKTLIYPQAIFSNTSLVEIKLITGRTHQIRVHCQFLAHPIVGDDKYGDENFNSEMKKAGVSRLFLHAKSLKFKHPVSGELLNPTASLDSQLQQFLDRAYE